MPAARPVLALPALPAAAARGRVLVGYSGGMDSTVLLHLLATSVPRPGRALLAVHVHHGLHPDADRWAGHCQRQCEGLGVPLHVVHVDVAEDRGPEGAARAARHAALAAIMEPGDTVALGHHREDQAETFLLRALRSSGVDGLGAIRGWRDFGPGALWRPMLGIPRARIAAHARAHGLAWIEDPTNDDVSIDRNFVRHEVMPVLRRRWPDADKAFAACASLAADAATLLGEGDEAVLAVVRGEDPRTLRVDALCVLDARRRARVVRAWVQDLGLPPLPAQGIACLEADLLPPPDGAQPRFAWGPAVIRRWRGLLHADAARPPLPEAWRARWDGTAPLDLPDGGTLALRGAPALPCHVHVHARGGGERIRLRGRAHHHSVKHVLQALAVPPWERERLPLVSAPDGTVVAIADIAYAERFADCAGSDDARLAWSDAARAPGGASAGR